MISGPLPHPYLPYLSLSKSLWWLILCVNLTGQWGAQLVDQTWFWWFLGYDYHYPCIIHPIQSINGLKGTRSWPSLLVREPTCLTAFKLGHAPCWSWIYQPLDYMSHFHIVNISPNINPIDSVSLKSPDSCGLWDHEREMPRYYPMMPQVGWLGLLSHNSAGWKCKIKVWVGLASGEAHPSSELATLSWYPPTIFPYLGSQWSRSSPYYLT